MQNDKFKTMSNGGFKLYFQQIMVHDLFITESPRITLIWGKKKYHVKGNRVNWVQFLLLKFGMGELTFAKSTFYQHLLHSFTPRS